MKVLVSAASRHGATLEIAGTIGNTLRLVGVDIDIRAPELVDSVEPYDAVILGSGIYAGHWLAPARDLVERELPSLLRRRLWLFSSGPIGEPPKPSLPPVEFAELTRRMKAVDHQVFEGRLDLDDLAFAEKAVVRVVGATAGDFRPWDAIVMWARGIAAALATERTPALAAAAG